MEKNDWRERFDEFFAKWLKFDFTTPTASV
jgi:hypothetical protein